ncbi:alpha/beta fold hydrolase [Marinobacter sp. V034]|uniref:alpha/beta fold hydrolase n=1 Tax=Marinobacter sp. V034 TaxID=3459610 RepID=UPI004043B534
MPDLDQKPTLILIHGAWAGSWGWHKLQPLLAASAIPSIAIDLPGNGVTEGAPGEICLKGYVEYVIQEIESVQGKVVLVGHSGGGVTATQVAEAVPERVAGIVFVTAMMLPSGMGFAQLTAALKAADPSVIGIGPHLEWSDDHLLSHVPAQAAKELFLHDLPEDEAEAAAAKLTPQPEGGRAIVARWTEEGFGSIPRLYVEALKDRSVVLSAQRKMQELVPGAKVVSLDTGHFPQAVAPEALAAEIVRFTDSLVDYT